MSNVEDHNVNVWTEEDEFTPLSSTVGLSLSEIIIIRAYCAALKQMELIDFLAEAAQTLHTHPDFTKAFCEVFSNRFDPNHSHETPFLLVSLNRPLTKPTSGAQVQGVYGAQERSVHQVHEHLSPETTQQLSAEGRLCKRSNNNPLFHHLYNLLLATMRTNFYKHDAKSLSLKFACDRIEGLIEPKPLYEIFVYSPRVEGCHLRNALVARGGIRWSTRLDDYRSEILQLMKTQTMKNAIIVPSGAKGGFVCKQFEKLKAEGATVEHLKQEVEDCYQIFIKGLLDLADDLRHAQSLMVRYDQDDPYLVVAADKGTAGFSDLANSIAQEYKFWLGDAFASGGSKGYDHKKMAITSRGAWISVQRHFYELGIDCQTQPITVVGVGDMSGDVFGNGMLLSRQLRLIAAFDHRHIFLDPNPDPVTAYNERLRLFNLPNSTWADYNPDCLSAGGGIFDRSLETISLSEQVRLLLKLDPSVKQINPDTLITHLLSAKVDLLWFGGIGTFIKASHETNTQVHDALNDAVRVNADQIQARVIGEGANLGMTQQARIEYACKGGRLNTDAIDNSAGVDCSDREVNLKILFLSAGLSGRDDLLSQAAAEVAEKVLTDNSAQNLILSLETYQLNNDQAIQEDLNAYQQLIQFLEQQPDLHFNAHLEALPNAQDFQKRKESYQPFTRPERAVVMAYVKIYLANQFLKAFRQNPDLAAPLKDEYESYFPVSIVKKFKHEIEAHPLKLEISSTLLANKIVNIMGPCWCIRLLANPTSDAQVHEHPSAGTTQQLSAEGRLCKKSIQTAQKLGMPEIEIALKFLTNFKSCENEWQRLFKETFTIAPDAVYKSLIALQRQVMSGFL